MSIANELSRLLQAKSDLATSITNKGVTVPASATLDDYPDLVDSIQTGGSSLPYDAEIEWLRSTGSGQYIDTGIAYASSVYIVAQMMLEGTTAGYYMFGIYTTVGGSARRWALQVATATTLGAHFGTITNKTLGFTRDAFHTISANYRYLSFADGSVLDTGASAFTPEQDVNIYLFARSDDNVAGGFRDCHLKYFKIYKSAALVRDYIPVRVGTVGYLYDKVSKTLFGNSGTGSFTLGNDIT